MYTDPELTSLFHRAMALFACRVCGTCCHGEGGIYIRGEEPQRIASFLNRTPEEFLSAFTISRNGKIYIRTGEDGACVFNLKACLIHPVKPAPCRRWPFFEPMLRDQENWTVARNACPALYPFLSLADYLAQRRLDAQGSPEDQPA